MPYVCGNSWVTQTTNSTSATDYTWYPDPDTTTTSATTISWPATALHAYGAAGIAAGRAIRAWAGNSGTATDTSFTIPYVYLDANWVDDVVLGGGIQPMLLPSAEQRAQERWRRNLAPAIVGRGTRWADFQHAKGAELVALRLLKSMVSLDQWRKYLKHGFVDVQGRSGLVYQIIRGQAHVRVYGRGAKVAELCVKLQNSHTMPPTDEVIAKLVIAECDEFDLWKRANVHQFPTELRQVIQANAPQHEQHLVQIAAA